jgi:sn-glycerol 3-phosphate transport system substrate-binding protein
VELALEQFESSNPMVQEPVMMMQGSIDSVIKDASTNLCEGSMNAEEATAYVVEECNKLFDEYNRANQ